MTKQDVEDMLDELGLGATIKMIEHSVPEEEQEELIEHAERLTEERMRRWTRPRKAWAFDPHEF